ncbi:MAG TPA: lipid-A-disaccharide synthase [Saprospiraceae bacterium]|nr:lipid-A-disaccharide synthase [Saprospiraceae bacterium]
MKYFVLAGEASGDKQAALLCEAIFKHDAEALIIGWGGEAMTATGVNVTRHYRDLAFMGFVEVIRHLPDIMKNFKKCKAEILAFKPDALVLVDYPGFNLRMATWAHDHQIPVYYYISPQLWAWHTSRVHKIKKAVRRMYVILPFEEAFYATYGMEVMYIGHPLAMVAEAEKDVVHIAKKGYIALLPGSRRNEVELILPEMVEMAKKMPDFHFQVAAVSNLPRSLYEKIISNQANIYIVQNDMHRVLIDSEAAIVASGTATLETALTGTPQVVVYKGNPFSYQIAKRLIKVPYIALVNLVADEKLVPELIQKECTPVRMKQTLLEILEPSRYKSIQAGYHRLKQKLTSGGGAEAAALDIISDLNKMKINNGQV